MVERDLAKVEVAGSTPVSRSSGVSLPIFPMPAATVHVSSCLSGAVPKW